jgi:RNA polymerase sigma factor (sigma-70 family)
VGSAISCDIDRANVCMRFKPLVTRTISNLNVDSRFRKDAEQEGMVGLLNAFDRYDASRGVHFSVFARPYVKGAIVRGIFRTSPTVDLVPVGDTLDLALIDGSRGQDRHGGEPLGDPDPEVTLIENLALRDWLDSLDPRDGWLVWRRYWQGATSAEIGAELTATIHWVNERHRVLIARGQLALSMA